MSDVNILKELKTAVLEGEDDLAQDIAKKAIKDGVDPIKLVNQGVVPAISEAGEKWKKNEYFQTDIILCAEAFRLAMEEIEPHLPAGAIGSAGKIIIGTVEGDVHDLGKILVIASLRSGGYEVIDLGVDVPTDTFISKVKEKKPNILGLGCYMTSTMPIINDIIVSLKNEGLRDDLKIMVGGAPTTQEFSDEIGADAWGKDAFDAIEKAKQLMEGI
ncbi:MAG: cobalamin-binding protein [archaeon]|nr:cobalamin-binding protein [archaeon]